MTRSGMAKKLLLKPGQKTAILSPPPGYLEALGELPEGAGTVAKSPVPLDFVHLFVKDQTELVQKIPATLRLLKEDGIFWVSYPKGSSRIKGDLSRDILRKFMDKHGFAGVAMISIDSNWTAMRFRLADKVGQKRKN